MNTAPISQIDLGEIQDTGVSEGKAKHLKECCIWALLDCQHTVGVEMRLDDDSGSSKWKVHWASEGVDVAAILGSYNSDDATQYGAEAIALLVSTQTTGYDTVQRSVTKTGIDYWLGSKPTKPDEPFQQASRLEISGILRESKTNKVSTRLKQKIAQTKPTDSFSPAYVFIVEFSTPYATVHLKK